MSGGGNSGGSDWSRNGRPDGQGGATGQGGSGTDGGADPCDIAAITNLNSPNPNVIRGLQAGDKLQIDLRTGPPRLLLAVTATGQTAGSITSPQMATIIQCILQGVNYVAEVISVRGGICQVRVHR